jgi:hypothetical protein
LADILAHILADILAHILPMKFLPLCFLSMMGTPRDTQVASYDHDGAQPF